MEKNFSLSQSDDYEITYLSKFLWWLSTAEQNLVADCVVDRNRYKIIGLSVLCTWAFATLTWTYFFSTIVEGNFIAICLGLFMGFIILCIDRALIKGITKQNKRKLSPLFFRGLLALTIGTFMAQPAVLYMFDKEIKLQASLDNEQKKMIKHAALDSLYLSKRNLLNAEEKKLTGDKNISYNEVMAARQNYLSEADGSGGTGKVGISTIALAKKAEYERLNKTFASQDSGISKKIAEIAISKKQIDSAQAAIEKDFEKYLNNGFLTRVEALNNILKSNKALQYRYYLIVFILMLIELMPVIAKTILPSGSYDEKATLREQLEIEIAKENMDKEKTLKSFYNNSSHEYNSEFVKSFFEKLKNQNNGKTTDELSRNGHESTNELWLKMKRDYLSKREN